MKKDAGCIVKILSFIGLLLLHIFYFLNSERWTSKFDWICGVTLCHDIECKHTLIVKTWQGLEFFQNLGKLSKKCEKPRKYCNHNKRKRQIVSSVKCFFQVKIAKVFNFRLSNTWFLICEFVKYKNKILVGSHRRKYIYFLVLDRVRVISFY